METGLDDGLEVGGEGGKEGQSAASGEIYVCNQQPHSKTTPRKEITAGLARWSM